MEVPKTVWLFDCQAGINVEAAVVALSRESVKYLCHDWVEPNWWTETPLPDEAKQEPDYDWDWVALLSRDQRKPGRFAVGLQTPDGRLQGALVYRVGVNSALEPAKKAIFVDRIASAPANREYLVQAPRFRGVGNALLRYAVAESWFYTFGGRVNLFPVANVDFYLKRNFKPTNVLDPKTGDVLYELSDADAESRLRECGVL
ncbi:MAG: hypothetical protein JNL58_31385 [Planctomyces sp.]|nr:hypothetical protein [Planctomyces sp.]